MEGSNEMHLEWCKQHMASLAIGSVWFVPRSGLTFEKTSADRLTLIRRGGGRGEQWEAYQDEDAALIKTKFEAAGFRVNLLSHRAREQGGEMGANEHFNYLRGVSDDNVPEGTPEELIATRDEFYTEAISERMGDQFHAILRRNPDQPDDQAFSVEGHAAIGYQLHDFIMARTLAYMNRHGRAPAGVRAELRLVWDDDRSDEQLLATQTLPWYSVDDVSGEAIAIDGRHRLEPFLDPERRR